MQTGWLSPSGEFFPCEIFEHLSLAREFIERLNISNICCESPDEVLLNAGWVQISMNVLGMKEQSIYWRRRLTDLQMRFLRPYYEENNLDVSFSSKCLWEKENDL